MQDIQKPEAKIKQTNLTLQTWLLQLQSKSELIWKYSLQSIEDMQDSQKASSQDQTNNQNENKQTWLYKLGFYSCRAKAS